MMMGDFNFPKKIVNWRESKLGLVADFNEGQDVQKKAFEQLLSLTEENQMEQIVNQPTRGKNVLDLIFTNMPQLFGECSTSIIKPQSDHDLVHFVMANPNIFNFNNSEEHQPAPVPEIATYNVHDADEEVLKKKFKEVNWREVLKVDENNKVDTLAERFINEVLRIFKQAKVTKYKDKTDWELPRKFHQNLINRRNRCQQKMNHPHCTNKEYISLEQESVQINTRIQEMHDAERERVENIAIANIDRDAKAFYRFANSSRKAQSKVGPLKSGTSYYSGPKEMARILSEQYKSVFSKPKDNYDDFTFNRQDIPTMEEILLDKGSFRAAMKSMKPSSAPGPDGVPAYLVCGCFRLTTLDNMEALAEYMYYARNHIVSLHHTHT